MHTVEMRLHPSELCAAMAEMRLWLDQHRFEPSAFCCREGGAGVLVRVEFKVTGEAEAFAGRFSGRIDGPGAEGGGMPGISPTLSAEGAVG
jgi:hypothetical protein